MQPAQVRMARAALGWSSEKLATRAKVHRNTVNNFEGGKWGGNTATIGRMRKAFEKAGIEFVGEDGVKIGRGNVPGGNIFYTRLAWERGVLDQLQWVLDPEAQRAFRDKARYWQREFGQGFYWAPGQMTPSRGPDLGRPFAVDDAPPAPAWALPYSSSP